MAVYDWDIEKNEWLLEERGISFERAIFLIENDGLLDIVQNPNSERYPSQKMFIVEIDEYAYLVPFVESEESTFLKTIIPSRKATGKYLGGSK